MKRIFRYSDPTRSRSLRALAWCAALATGLLMASPPSVAGLAATYIGCVEPQFPLKKPDACQGTWQITHAPAQFQRMVSFVGYVDQTPVPGTAPAYLTCNVVPNSQPARCDGRWFISPTPNSVFDSFVGYPFTSQVADTAPMYLTCTLMPFNPRVPPVCVNKWEATAESTRPFTSLIGYVYSTPPITRYGFSPKYLIGSVIYVPPGQGPSTITYGAGTMTGSTLSTSESWNVSSTYGIAKGIVSISFGNSFGGATSTSTDMQITTAASRTYRGPASNALNHDYDEIIVYLGAQVTADVDFQGNVVWGMDLSQMPSLGYSSSGYPIAVGCLRPNSTIPPALCADTLNFLNANGITAADYPQMLSVHPFADPSASPSPDPKRYVLIDAVNFLPDPTTSTYTYTLSNSSTITNSQTTSLSYTVELGFASTASILKQSNKLTFTQSSTESNRTGSSSTSSFTVSLPSAPYGGPGTLFIYLDTIYKTFMFSFSQ